MRQWSGGPLYSEIEAALTGTSRRQKTLPRVLHNHKDENIAEPFAYSNSERYENRNAQSEVIFPSSEDCPSSKCVYTYEDRYMFSRIISGTDLLFDSHFESGNLCQAFRKDTHISGFSEYDLTLNHDVHSIGHTQWFYFSVSNVVAGMTVKFNIGIFSKRTSLFNNGMMPLLYSEKKGKWCRCGQSISYFQVRRGNIEKKRVYALTFSHQFEYSGDKCFFAYSYPYTYSDLQDDLRSLQLDKSKSKTFRRSVLSRSLGCNRCDVLSITEQTSCLKELQQRQGILISSRVHPGETVASWICKGIINFLTSDCDSAKELRRAYVVKIIPMLNPDGVVNGNYRTSLSGVDLNRRWERPHKLNHPTIYNTKILLKRFQKTRAVIASCDIHGHSRREGLFMYGCPDSKGQSKIGISPRIIPDLFDAQCEFFSKHKCTFRVQGCKASTMRVVMYHEFGIQSSYTLEASLSGYKGFHFSLSDLQMMGRDFCLSLLQMHRNRTMQVKCNVDMQCITSKHFINYDQTTFKKTGSTTNMFSEKNNISTEDDSGGSDSNPSEDNISESEALQLLSHVHPLTRKKKKKKKIRNSKKKKNKLKNNDNSTRRRIQPCTIVQIGVPPLSVEKRNICYTTQQGMKSKNPQEKKIVKCLTFPL